MTDAVPPARQCAMCGREAVDPERTGGLCPDHHPDHGDTVEDAAAETETTAEADPDEYIEDDDFTGTVQAVREHYRRAKPVYDRFADLEGCPTTAIVGNAGWYNYIRARDGAGQTELRRRSYTFETDFAAIMDFFEPDEEDSSWRTLYNITSWKDSDAIYAGATATDADDFERGEGLAGYGDLRGFPLWVDLDLADDVKRKRGALSDAERETAEATIRAYVDEFADLAGVAPEQIAVLDSGGGAYVYTPAAATLPIADRFEDDTGPYVDAREAIFEELHDRLKRYGVDTIQPRVDARVDGAADLFDPDWVQNVNRQSKAPLSIHGDHDIVVTPARSMDDPGQITYEPTPVSATDDDLVEHAAREAEKIVSVPDDRDSLEATTETFVETLFAEYADRPDTDGWRDVLDEWLADAREQRRAEAHQRALDEKAQRERHADRFGEADSHTATEILTQIDVTPLQKDVIDALEDRSIVDVREVIRHYASDAWDTSKRGHETTFNPSWRTSGSGKSCAVPTGENRFIDNACDGGGGPARAYALGTGLLPGGRDAAARPLSGEAWGEALDGLRGEGYPIPIYVPEAGDSAGNGDTYDETPLWGLRNGAVALGVCDREDFVERETDDGDTYLGFPDTETFNQTLDVLAEAGINHGREPVDGDAGGRYEIQKCTPPEYDPDPFDKREMWDALQERYSETADADAPVVWGDPAGAGKTTNALKAALDAGRDTLALFEQHKKAREVATDDALPDWFDPYHFRGQAQKRDPDCMDADHADEDCPTHGDTADCPSMCPAKDLAPDDPLRRRYEALARITGEAKAHVLLGDELPGHDEDGRCAWYDQFDEAEHAAHILGVHEYQTLKSLRDGRDVIVDEKPGALASETTLDIEDLSRLARELEEWGDALPRSNPMHYTARRFASFATEIREALLDDDTALADVDPPVPVWDTYETWNDAAGHHVDLDTPTDPWEYGEALAQFKVQYSERARDRLEQDTWDGAPVSIDALLIAAGEAGLPTDPALQAVGLGPTLDHCPWCHADLTASNGARCCTSCEWHEAENALLREDASPARATGYLRTQYDSTAALVTERLPPAEDLPDAPLILDATATPDRIATLYDVERDDVTIRGQDTYQANMDVTQVLNGAYHGSTIEAGMTDDDGTPLPREEWTGAAAKLQEIITEAGQQYDRPLFGVKKGLKDRFKWPDNGEVMHYHAVRGLNRGDCDAVVAVGAPHPNPDALRREAELLAMHRDDVQAGGAEHSTRPGAPNPPVYRKLNYEDENGDGRAVPTKHYSGLTGALFREGREKELEQFTHRARPLLAEDTVDVVLATDVPTEIPVDTVCRLDEIASPLEALLPVPDGAVDLLDAVQKAHAGEIDGFRADALVERQDDGTLANKPKAYHRLARLAGLDVTQKTIYNWVHELEDLGLLDPGEYEQRAGRAYAVDVATLKRALQVFASNSRFEVAAARRFRALAGAADGTTAWLDWARTEFGLDGGGTGGDPPPDPV
jgi:hypothetical protein